MNRAELELCRWHAVADKLALQQAAIETILASAAQAIHERGRFHLVLAGGNTPRGIYHGLPTVQTDWSAWHIYFGDERCLPPADPARNSRMAAEVWLDRVPIPAFQSHAIPGELGAVQAARMYRSEEHTSELQSPCNLVCRLLLEKTKQMNVAEGAQIADSVSPPPNTADSTC